MGDKNVGEEGSRGKAATTEERSLRSRFLAWITPGFIRRRYAVKFTLAVTVIILVIGAAGAVTYVDARETARDTAAAQVKSTVQLQADSLSRWIEGFRTQTRTLSTRESLSESNRSAIRERLRAAKNHSSNGVAAAYLVDSRRDTVVASTEESVEGRSLDEVEMPWSNSSVAATLESEDDVWTSRAYRSSVHHDHELMAFASPVAGDEDLYLVLVGEIFHSVENLHQPATKQTTWIVNAGGETVLASNATDVTSPEDNAGHIQSVHEGDSEEHGHDDGGGHGTAASVEFHEHGEYILAYTPIEGTDWVAVTAVNKNEAYALSNAVGRNILLLVTASLVSLIVVGVVLGRRTVRPLADLRERSERMERGELDVTLETHRDDEFGRLYAAFASMRDALREQIETAEQLNRHLEHKADEYHDVMEDCAGGDLTRRMDPDSQNKAMSSIAEAFNEMMADIEETMTNLKAFADDVAAASEMVTASSEEVYSASEQVTESIQEISDGADEQNGQLQAVADEMGSLSATTEEIAASSNEVAELAEETANVGRSGREAAREAIRGLDAIETTSEEAVAEIEKLEAEVAEIDELIEFLTEIATQTNMLALNASIEVSRSGAEGSNEEGFAAVANKIQELADEAKIAAQDIEQRLGRITEQTERTGKEVQSASDQISEQTDSIERAIDALEEIADFAQETNTGIQKISDTTEQQAASTQEVVAMVDELTAISDTTTSEAENVAAAAEEQTTALTEVSRSASDLTVQAERLSEALNRFDTDADVSGSLVEGEEFPHGGENGGPSDTPDAESTPDRSTPDDEEPVESPDSV